MLYECEAQHGHHRTAAYLSYAHRCQAPPLRADTSVQGKATPTHHSLDVTNRSSRLTTPSLNSSVNASPICVHRSVTDQSHRLYAQPRQTELRQWLSLGKSSLYCQGSTGSCPHLSLVTVDGRAVNVSVPAADGLLHCGCHLAFARLPARTHHASLSLVVSLSPSDVAASWCAVLALGGPAQGAKGAANSLSEGPGICAT